MGRRRDMQRMHMPLPYAAPVWLEAPTDRAPAGRSAGRTCSHLFAPVREGRRCAAFD